MSTRNVFFFRCLCSGHNLQWLPTLRFFFLLFFFFVFFFCFVFFWQTLELSWVLVFVYHNDYFFFIYFRFDALIELGAFMRTGFLCVSVLRVASVPRVELVGRKNVLTIRHPTPTHPPPPPTHTHTRQLVVYSTDRSSKAVLPVLVLLFVVLCFILRAGLFRVLPCVVLFSCFSSFWHCDYIARGGESWSWCCSCVCSICACLVLSVSSFSSCLRILDGLRLVIVALTGLFSYLS